MEDIKYVRTTLIWSSEEKYTSHVRTYVHWLPNTIFHLSKYSNSQSTIPVDWTICNFVLSLSSQRVIMRLFQAYMQLASCRIAQRRYVAQKILETTREMRRS